MMNVKNKIEYHYIEEKNKNDQKGTKQLDDFEKTAFDIFDKEKIKIE